VLSFVVTVLEAGDGNRYDIAVVWRAAGRLVAGEPLYVDGAFLYPPGAALLFAPLAARRCGLRTPRGAPLRRSGRSADCAVPEGDRPERHTGPMKVTAVRRVDYGYFVRPAAETGTGASRVEPCLGYLVDHPDGLLLLDTGMGTHPDVDAHYRPRRRSLPAALVDASVRLDDVGLVVNCHLHFDHCGGNPQLAGRPIFTQRSELAAARSADYTLPELVDAPGLRYEELDGDAEVLPGVLVIPTPGHTAGHQSLVVRCDAGTVVVAGQSHDTATAYSADVLAWRAHRDGHSPPLPTPPSWIERLQALDPARVVFAHDHAVWTP
jgi:N-acyl homoserine lactone hydrolase